MAQRIEHKLLLNWLMLTGFLIFVLFVTWHQGVLLLLFQSDKSKLSWLICLIYAFVSIHCVVRVIVLSVELNLARKIAQFLHHQVVQTISTIDGQILINQDQAFTACRMTDYLLDVFGGRFVREATNVEKQNIKEDKNLANTSLLEVLEYQLKAPHEIGWFISDMMLKLGLLGTIIGFIFMLSSVADITDFDVATMQVILQNMSNGMGTALYTTMAGLIGSILSSAQYQMLDKSADELVDMAKHLTYCARV